MKISIPMPNVKNLPFYAIGVLVAFSTGLLGYIVTEGAKHDTALSTCHNEIRDSRRELTAYLLKQDSINRAHLAQLNEIKNK